MMSSASGDQSQTVDSSRVEDRFEKERENIGSREIEQVLEGFEDKFQQIKASRGPRWVRRALGHARLFYRMLQTWWEEPSRVPWRTVTAITAGLIYLINPFDLIPDIIPMAGLMDDATMIYLVFGLVQDDLLEFADEHGFPLDRYDIDPDRPRPDLSD